MLHTGTDKLYITHSEWASEDAYSASHGAGVSRSKGTSNIVSNTFKRLAYNYCALTLIPWITPVCTASGTLYDLESIVTALAKDNSNIKDPITDQKIKRTDLLSLNFSKNADGDFADPVTGKVFTPNTHLVAIKTSGNVFAWETIERLNIKAKNWRDLVSDDEFTRKDLITLQDPMSVDGKGYIKPEVAEDGEDRIAKAKKAVERARFRAHRGNYPASNGSSSTSTAVSKVPGNGLEKPSGVGGGRALPYNAAQHTTGRAAASFTSTSVTPHTSADRALLSEEEYMLKPKRVKQRGYATMQTSLGDLTLELFPEYAPKTVWNFVKLSKKGYYRGLKFHRNIRNFMIQGGDPTGTGRGGESIWGKTFGDEFDPHMLHDGRGILAMANKGKDTNLSQFFITYRAAKHLDRKHTVFGKVVGGMDVLAKLEAVKTDEGNKPVEDILLLDVVVYVDPFEEFLREREEKEKAELEREEIRKQGGAEEDRVTWTGKRIRADGMVEEQDVGSVGKYLSTALATRDDQSRTESLAHEDQVPVKKKAKSGGFGNFDGW
jgi:peptidyl-prolyl cis-trans isomerase-like 2